MSETYDLPGVTPAPAPDPASVPEPVSGAGAEEAGAVPEQRPEPLGVTVEPTGNADVDAAVERLGDADELPTAAHIEVYEDVHAGLRQALAALDENRG
ncbi:hypothetical protein [Actinacidiphila yeochonensis]|uniref:hypothetical protein n=1 Tax=Actinacidiphila yeochonensis TaxID=89050 RepID=UPI0005633ADF|nr:hypothetical protein [Actinacidiphila yeochonensis]